MPESCGSERAEESKADRKRTGKEDKKKTEKNEKKVLTSVRNNGKLIELSDERSINRENLKKFKKVLDKRKSIVYTI